MTLKMFTVLNFLSGLEASLVTVTLIFYLKELHTPASSLPWLMGVIFSVDHVAEILFLFIIPPVADKWGCIRLLVFSTNAVLFAGNLIYSLDISPYLLILGRFLCGIGTVNVTFQAGEIARCYDSQSVDAALSWLSGGFATGFVIGPALSYAFKYVNFYIGQWHISFTNSPCLFLALVYVIVQIFSYFMVSDLYKSYISLLRKGDDEIYRVTNSKENSKTEENPKSHEKDTEGAQFEKSEIEKIKAEKMKDFDSMSDSKESAEKFEENWKGALIKLIGSLSTCWIIIASGVISYLFMNFLLWLQLIAIKILHFDSIQLISCYVGLSFICISLVFLFPLLDKLMGEIVLILGTICLLMNASVCLLVLQLLKSQWYIQTSLFGLFIVSFGAAFTAEYVMLKCILAKRVEASFQCTAEGIRAGASRIGFLLGGLLAGLTYGIFPFMCIAFVLVLSIVFSLIVYSECMTH